MKNVLTLASDMVWVTHAGNIGMQIFQCMLGMARTHGHSLRHLLVNDYINPDALFRFALQDSIQSPLLVVRRRATKINFGC